VPLLSHAAADEGAAYLGRYGECAVRLDPAAARTLLLTEPETDAEAAAFNAMGTALGTCVAAGKSVSFGKAALRGSIAANYYRLAVAAHNAASTGAAR
jgi:hypothetical protein